MTKKKSKTDEPEKISNREYAVLRRAVLRRHYGKTGRRATEKQLDYWLRKYEIDPPEDGPKPGDKYRFTYEVGGYLGYVGRPAPYVTARVVKYGPTRTSITLKDLEEFAADQMGLKTKQVGQIFMWGDYAEPNLEVVKL
jgi:hypothetical protein